MLETVQISWDILVNKAEKKITCVRGHYIPEE